MRVIILTSERYLAANIAVRSFLSQSILRRHHISVVGLVSVMPFHVTPKSLKNFYRLIKSSGLVFALKLLFVNSWQNLLLVLGPWFYPAHKRQYATLEELCQQHQIPYRRVKNINDLSVVDWVKEQKADYLVSCLLLQIVKSPLLEASKKGAINFHPALFSQHRGSFASFWTLAKNRQFEGATIHFMTPKLDDGPVILQRRFFVKPSDSMFCISRRSAILGGKLLAIALRKLKRQQARQQFLAYLSQILSIPSRRQVDRFNAQGKQLIRWKDLWRV